MGIRDLRKDLGDNRGNVAAWVKWAVREKRIVYLLVLGLVAMGVAGLASMNKDEFPSFQIKQGLVAGVYPGASVEEVEEQLTKPLEETLFSYREVIRESVHSVSCSGICYIYADLNVPQEKKDEVWSKIKLGLQARKMTLPAGVLAVAVLDDFSNTSSLLIAMESEDKSYLELQEFADGLCDRLRLLPELAKASVVGKQTEEIAITLDREKLSSYGINPTAILLDYMTSAMPVPSGTFETGYTNAPIRIRSTVGNEREIAERIVYSDLSGNVIRLKDIASIERRYKDPSEFVAYNGHNCLIINVEMRPDNNIVAFGRDVDRVMSEFTASVPPSVRMSRIMDQPKVVKTSVWSFLRDLVISMLVVIAVMLMLFPMRSALIASSGVPVCTAIALAVMSMTGMDLNTVTLAALIVVLGMIVDDSIITMDGYMEQNAKGFRGVDAAAESARELFFPTFIATLAICLMFFPCKYIITGYLGDFVSLFPWVILIALMTSLVYAVSVVPSLEVRFILVKGEGKKNFVARIQDKFFTFLQKVYEKVLERCFRHPVLTILSGVAAVGLGIAFFSRLNIQMMPKAARDYFVVEMYTESGNGIEHTKACADSLTSILLGDDRVKSVTAFIGTGAPRFSATYAPILPSPHTAQLIVNTMSNRATEALISEYENRYEHLFPSVLIRFKQMDYQGVEAPIAVKISGDRREDLLLPAERIRRYMAGLPGELKWVHSDSDDFEPCIDVELDADEAGRIGINKAVLALSLAGTFNGQNIATLWEGATAVPVNIYSDGISSDMPYETIANQLVPSALPALSVPLRQIAAVNPDISLARLIRDNGQPAVNVYADLKFGKSQPAAEKKIKEWVEKNIIPDLPQGVGIQYCGLSSTNAKVIPEIAWSFLAACSILFLFLLIHFKKASIAVLTMVLSLLCLFGAAFGLWIFGLDFSITAVLGLISLVGIIVRNGILMFEYAEEARFERGEDCRTASFEAGTRRMRPIFLTSCTTALGVLPMIISGDMLWMPMGVVICFGTLLTIFLITLVMPVSYWCLFRKKEEER